MTSILKHQLSFVQKQLWSTNQMQWFLKELGNWQNYSMIIFVSSVPWIGGSTVCNASSFNSFSYSHSYQCHHILGICCLTLHFSLCTLQEFGEWSSVPDQRRQIADFISQNGIDNLVIVAGDAHMVCILRIAVSLS
jgi:phosphodiesterase/alkaline phosphatase D-like protein